jgi:hypothetical protein
MPNQAGSLYYVVVFALPIASLLIFQSFLVLWIGKKILARDFISSPRSVSTAKSIASKVVVSSFYSTRGDTEPLPKFKWRGTDHVSQSNLHRNRYLGSWFL